jgi:hypothetical protein
MSGPQIVRPGRRALVIVTASKGEDQMTEVTGGHVLGCVDRVFDPVRRPERPLALLATSTKDRNSPSPNPGILGLGSYEPRPSWVVTHIIHPIDKTIVRSQNMIKKLVLPNWTSPLESHVDQPRRAALDGLHDLRQTVAPAVAAAERGVDQVHMIGHYHRGMQVKLAAVLFDGALENNVASCGWELPATIRGEGDEQAMIVFLIMR